MSNWENIGSATARNYSNSNKKLYNTDLLVSIIGNRIMYKTDQDGYLIVPAEYLNYNAKFRDEEGDEFYLNVPYWS